MMKKLDDQTGRHRLFRECALYGACFNAARLNRLYGAILMSSNLLTIQAYALPAANTLPAGESVAIGSASFNRTINNRLIVNQNSDRLLTNWNSFDIGSNAQVTFIQPDSHSVALNRITTGSPTAILGSLNSNGQLFIINPSGITFGAGSEVRASSVVASVFDITDKDFGAGLYLFNRAANSTGQIENLGHIRASSGVVALLANRISNGANLTAAGGDIALLNADQTLLSDTGATVMQAASVQGSIQSSGRLEATTLAGLGGRIILEADRSDPLSHSDVSGYLKAAGSVSVSASNINLGQLNTSSDTALVAGNTHINGVFNLRGASSHLAINGAYGLAGSTAKINLLGAASAFSVNGTDYTVIRNISQLQAISSNAATLAGNYVLGGDINAMATATWNSGTGFQPLGDNSTPFSGILDGLGHAVNALRIRRPLETVALFGSADNASIANISLRNASISGRSVAGLVFSSVNTLIDNSSFSGNLFIRQAEGDAQLISAGLVAMNSGTISNSHADAYFSSRVVALDAADVFTGGLAGVNSGVIQHSDASGSVSGFFNVGGLVGLNTGLISDSGATASVTGDQAYIGGLVGSNMGVIAHSYATGVVVNQGNNGMDTGGLIGRNSGMVTNSHATGNVAGYLHAGGLIGYAYTDAVSGYSSVVSSSYATGNVRGAYHTGGLIGEGNAVTVSNSYASGAVQGSQYAGGLVGWLHDATLGNSYATGAVSGGYAVGSLLGRADNNMLSNSYWNTASNGQVDGIGLVPIGMHNTANNLQGLSSVQIKQVSSFVGWDISTDPLGSSIWYIDEGSNPPVLR